MTKADNRWRKCSEEVPEQEERVLLLDGRTLLTGSLVGSNYVDDRGLLFDVTHWMPLPDLPEEE